MMGCGVCGRYINVAEEKTDIALHSHSLFGGDTVFLGGVTMTAPLYLLFSLNLSVTHMFKTKSNTSKHQQVYTNKKQRLVVMVTAKYGA